MSGIEITRAAWDSCIFLAWFKAEQDKPLAEIEDGVGVMRCQRARQQNDAGRDRRKHPSHRDYLRIGMFTFWLRKRSRNRSSSEIV